MGEAQATKTYVCPMHPSIQNTGPGKCPKCGMDLLPQGAGFAILRHMAKNPLMAAIMIIVMFAIMATGMMLMR